jgi:hypothetical protein
VQTTCQSALHPAKSLVFFIKPSTDKLKNDMAAECPKRESWRCITVIASAA